jgi:hypothetical protein
MKSRGLAAAIAASLVNIIAAASDKTPAVVPSTVFLITEIKDIVSVRGTWTIPDAKTPGERIADPVNAVQIWCEKPLHKCFEALARVQYGDLLSAEVVPYDVTGWTKQEITAETGALCATSVLTINIVSQEVFRITRNGGLSQEACNKLAWRPLKRPVIEKLVSGVDAMTADRGAP